MLDKDKRDPFPFVMLGFALAMIILFIVLFTITTGDHVKFVETLDGMSCGELLTEIKAEHGQYEGYGYIDTWIEKECWKD